MGPWEWGWVAGSGITVAGLWAGPRICPTPPPGWRLLWMTLIGFVVASSLFLGPLTGGWIHLPRFYIAWGLWISVGLILDAHTL